MKYKFIDLFDKKVFGVILLFLVVITLATDYYGSTDLADYSDTAKYFSGKYAADLRSSHSYLYGFLHAPFMMVADSFIIFKLTSLLFLFLIALSAYWISKEKKALIILIFSPVAWYMAPWINPIQLASLCLLWSYYFITRYEQEGKSKYLLFSGLFVGLGWAFWDTVLFFGTFLAIAFLYNRKSYNLLFFLIGVVGGLLPRLVLDYYLFSFPFFSLMKSFFGTLTNALYLGRGTTYSMAGLVVNIILFGLIFLSIPLYYWRFYRKRYFLENKKSMLFLTLSLLLIAINPQIRYTMILVPIITVMISKNLTSYELKKQTLFSLGVILLFFLPTVAQTIFVFNHSDYSDITSIVTARSLSISKNSDSDLIKQDIQSITNDFNTSILLVGGHQDYYQWVAHEYWGDEIKEFVSIQDYELWQKNETTLFEKRFEFYPNIQDRRSIWFGGGITRNTRDTTDYQAIQYGITLYENDSLVGFHRIKDYSMLTVWKKDNSF